MSLTSHREMMPSPSSKTHFRKRWSCWTLYAVRRCKPSLTLPKSRLPNGSHTSKPMLLMTFLMPILTDNMLQAPCLHFPIPFSRKMNMQKGRLEVQKVVNNFSEYERMEKEKQKRNIWPSRGLKI